MPGKNEAPPDADIMDAIDAMDQNSAEQRKRLGRGASLPHQIPFKGWWRIAGRLVGSFFRDRVMLVSAGVTLYMLIALVPALSTVVSIYGLFARPETIGEQVALLNGIVPQGGLDLIRDQLTRIASQGQDSLGWALIAALAVAIWSASLGVKGLFEAMNVAYGEREKRGIIKKNALALLFTFGAAMVAVTTLTVVVVLPAILSILPMPFGVESAVRVLSFFLLATILLGGLSVLYRWGPSRVDAKWQWITPGAIFAVVDILVVSILFSWFVASFGTYTATYGSLGAIIGFLTWLWISVIAVVMGAELNAEMELQTAMDTTMPPDKPIGQRGAFVADTVQD